MTCLFVVITWDTIKCGTRHYKLRYPTDGILNLESCKNIKGWIDKKKKKSHRRQVLSGHTHTILMQRYSSKIRRKTGKHSELLEPKLSSLPTYRVGWLPFLSCSVPTSTNIHYFHSLPRCSCKPPAQRCVTTPVTCLALIKINVGQTNRAPSQAQLLHMSLCCCCVCLPSLWVWSEHAVHQWQTLLRMSSGKRASHLKRKF